MANTKNSELGVFESFTDNILYDALKFRIILYLEEMIFEYNNRSNKIRPINSIKWDVINPTTSNVSFIRFLDTNIEKIISSFCELGYIDHSTPIGLLSDEFVVVSLDEIPELITSDVDLIETFTVDEMLSNSKTFINYLKSIYKENN